MNKNISVNDYIDLDGTFNFRDLGGIETEDEKVTRPGLLFRSDALDKLSDKDISRLIDMQLKTVVDFRAASEIADSPNRILRGVRTIVLSPIADVAMQASTAKGDDTSKIRKMEERAGTPEGRDFFIKNRNVMEGQMRSFVSSESGIACYSTFLKLLVDSSNVPLVFHCRGGKDRTGWAAALLLLALGVSRENALKDYMKTAVYNKARNDKRMEEYRELTDNETVLDFLSGLMQVKESYLLAAFDEVDKLGGLSEYLHTSLRMSKEEISMLKENYIW